MTNLVRRNPYILIGAALLLVNTACETNRGFRATRLDKPPIQKTGGDNGQDRPAGTQLPPMGDPAAPVEVERGIPDEQAMAEARQEAIDSLQEQAPQLSEEKAAELVDGSSPDSTFATMVEEIKALDAIRLIKSSGQVTIALVGVIAKGLEAGQFFMASADLPADAVNNLGTEVALQYVPHFRNQSSMSAADLANAFGYEFSAQCTKANCDEFQIKARLAAGTDTQITEEAVFTFAPIVESPTGFFKVTADTLRLLRNNEMVSSLATYALREATVLHALFIDMESEVTTGQRAESLNAQVVIKGVRASVNRASQVEVKNVAELNVEMVLDVKGQPINIKARSNMDWVRGLINQPQPDEKISMQILDAKTNQIIPGIKMFFACDNDCGNIRLRMDVEETGSTKFFYFSNNGALPDRLTLISSSAGTEGLDYEAAVQAFEQILTTQQQEQAAAEEAAKQAAAEEAAEQTAEQAQVKEEQQAEPQADAQEQPETTTTESTGTTATESTGTTQEDQASSGTAKDQAETKSLSDRMTLDMNGDLLGQKALEEGLVVNPHMRDKALQREQKGTQKEDAGQAKPPGQDNTASDDAQEGEEIQSAQNSSQYFDI